MIIDKVLEQKFWTQTTKIQNPTEYLLCAHHWTTYFTNLYSHYYNFYIIFRPRYENQTPCKE